MGVCIKHREKESIGGRRACRPTQLRTEILGTSEKEKKTRAKHREKLDKKRKISASLRFLKFLQLDPSFNWTCYRKIEKDVDKEIIFYLKLSTQKVSGFPSRTYAQCKQEFCEVCLDVILNWVSELIEENAVVNICTQCAGVIFKCSNVKTENLYSGNHPWSRAVWRQSANLIRAIYQINLPFWSFSGEWSCWMIPNINED